VPLLQDQVQVSSVVFYGNTQLEEMKGYLWKVTWRPWILLKRHVTRQIPWC
jgi:hypothetical protein